jgi:hypothetical protein
MIRHFFETIKTIFSNQTEREACIDKIAEKTSQQRDVANNAIDDLLSKIVSKGVNKNGTANNR